MSVLMNHLGGISNRKIVSEPKPMSAKEGGPGMAERFDGYPVRTVHHCIVHTI
jgi:hypothetical protein